MRTGDHTARAGFTLIEAIIAIVILSVAVPAMFWAIHDAGRTRADPVVLARARWLASEKLEDVLADRYSATRGYGYVASGNYAPEGSVAGFPGFSRSVTVAESGPYQSGGPTGGSGYKTVTVHVNFVDGRGRARTLDLSTVVASFAP